MTELRMKNGVSFFVPVAFIASMLFSGCSKQKTKSDMNFEELRENSGMLLKKQNHAEAAEILEETITRHPDRPDIHKFKIILADVYFKLERYQLAYQMYQNYAQQYPSHTRAEYAKYQAVLSKFYQTLKIDCDQTLTNETIAACKEYAAQPYFKKYLQDVIDIQNTCEHKLINKEIYVFNFYLNQDKTDAARNRLNHIKSTFLSQKPSLEARLCYLECKLAQKINDKKSIQENLALLTERYPSSPFTRMTQDLINKPTFIF